MNRSRKNYLGFFVSSRVSLILLAKGEGDGDVLDGGVGGHGVVVSVNHDGDVGLGGGNDVAFENANI